MKKVALIFALSCSAHAYAGDNRFEDVSLKCFGVVKKAERTYLQKRTFVSVQGWVEGGIATPSSIHATEDTMRVRRPNLHGQDTILEGSGNDMLDGYITSAKYEYDRTRKQYYTEYKLSPESTYQTGSILGREGETYKVKAATVYHPSYDNKAGKVLIKLQDNSFVAMGVGVPCTDVNMN